MARKEGERLRGRLQFAEAQISGKVACRAYKRLFRFILEGGGPLTDEVRATLLTLRDRVNFAPRYVCANLLNLMHIYVDASCEGTKVGLGGVVINVGRPRARIQRCDLHGQ